MLTAFWYISGGALTPEGLAGTRTADIFSDRGATVLIIGLEVKGYATFGAEDVNGIEGRTNASEPGATEAPSMAMKKRLIWNMPSDGARCEAVVLRILL